VSDPPRAPRDEELEELSDDVILAQESAVHAPQRRANVTTDHPTVVISEPAAGERRRQPTVRTRRGANEKTVVIRDRRKLDKMRQALSEREDPKRKPRLIETRTLYLLAGAAVGSLVVGSLIAALVDSRQNDLKPTTSAAVAPPPAASSDAKPKIDTVDLDSLPVDKSRRHLNR
jgi:hypothetical protein